MMTYPNFPERTTFELDGVWDFAWLGNTVPLADFQPSDDLVFDEKEAVPGVFDMGVKRYEARGLGVYRTRVKNVPAGKLRLKIGGLGLVARIYWDGVLTGTADCAYLPVTCDFQNRIAGEHTLIIAVDNRYASQPYPFFRAGYDFYAFGGIYRSVRLSVLPETDRIERVQITTEDLAAGTVRLRVLLPENADGTVALDIAFDQGKPETYHCAVKDGAAVLVLPVPSFRCWSPESPFLHTVTVRTDGDRIVERFGIRTIEARNGKLYLNGSELYLHGVNRHASRPQSGPVETVHEMMEDIHLIKHAGMNFVRSVHYPQDQTWLDLCDENGLLVWEETLGWGLREDAVTEQTMELFAGQNRLMIRESFNHPSIIIWAMLNECASQMEESRPVYGYLLRDMKAEDPSRLRSYASCMHTRDICFDEADVISLNTYPGWIGEAGDSETLASEYIPPRVKDLADHYVQEQFCGKPILMSEIGACGLYGFHDRNYAPWSEEFQADYMSKAVQAICADSRYCGYALWQFCDTRSYQRGAIRGKTRGFNCAGLVDEYRRIKLVYDAVAETIRSAGKKGEK